MELLVCNNTKDDYHLSVYSKLGTHILLVGSAVASWFSSNSPPKQNTKHQFVYYKHSSYQKLAASLVNKLIELLIGIAKKEK